MEYRLALTMNSDGIFASNLPYASLLSTPGYDYVNPGLSNIARLYDLYVPIYHNNSPFLLETIENNQTGSGLNENVDKNENAMLKNEQKNVETLPSIVTSKSLVENDDLNQTDKNTTIIATDDIKPNENLKRKLSEGILDSFQHPKFKVSKIAITKSNKPKVEQKKIHKFKII